ncbi:hypothetical protein KM043_006698 [Ampulex compressa]|nr:hypothetical protein KM043_006698 [Ampulex compressa]
MAFDDFPSSIEETSYAPQRSLATESREKITKKEVKESERPARIPVWRAGIGDDGIARRVNEHPRRAPLRRFAECDSCPIDPFDGTSPDGVDGVIPRCLSRRAEEGPRRAERTTREGQKKKKLG